MSLWRDDPERAADALIVSSLDDLDLPASDKAVVLAMDAGPALRRALLEDRSCRGIALARRASALEPTPVDRPPAETVGTFTVAFLRLPKSKDELEFTAHRVAGWMAPAGRIFIYGGNDEGIRSVPKRLESLGVAVETVAAHSHGRVLALERPAALTHVKTRDSQWRVVHELDFGDGTLRPWVSYPGLFAGGGLDAGTALLLAHLPPLAKGGTALDFGCGTGVIARAILDRDPTAKVTALDVDTFALMATHENAPAARTMLGYRLKGTGRHDLIASNPPIHTGVSEDYATLHQLIEDAPMHLRPKGRLLLVVQRRVPVEAQLKAQFDIVETVADRGVFRLWCATQPTRRGGNAGTETSSISDEIEPW